MGAYPPMIARPSRSALMPRTAPATPLARKRQARLSNDFADGHDEGAHSPSLRGARVAPLSGHLVEQRLAAEAASLQSHGSP
jgi:hypothetical protein